MGHGHIAEGGLSLIFLTLKRRYSLQRGIYPAFEARSCKIARQHHDEE